MVNAILENETPTEDQWPVLYVENGLQQYLDILEEKTSGLVLNAETEEGRKEIGSLALKVSRSKTAIEKPGREHLRKLKAKIKPAEAEIKRFVDRCDEIRAEILKPKEEWEQREINRVASHEAKINTIQSIIDTDYSQESSESLKRGLDNVIALEPDEFFEEYLPQALFVWNKAKDQLEKALNARVKYEAEQEELEALRAEKAERDRKDREEKIALEAAENERIDRINVTVTRTVYSSVEQLCHQRDELERLRPPPSMDRAVALWQTETELLRLAIEDAIQKREEQRVKSFVDMLNNLENATTIYSNPIIGIDAINKITIDDSWAEFKERGLKLKAEALEKLHAWADEIEQKAKDEAEEKARKELEAKQAAEKAKEDARRADVEHKRKINNEAKTDLLQILGPNESLAESIIEIIARGQIRHVTINY